MNKSGYKQTKESTIIRKGLNRHRRRLAHQILNLEKDDNKIPNYKNTSGWLTW